MAEITPCFSATCEDTWPAGTSAQGSVWLHRRSGPSGLSYAALPQTCPKCASNLPKACFKPSPGARLGARRWESCPQPHTVLRRSLPPCPAPRGGFSQVKASACGRGSQFSPFLRPVFLCLRLCNLGAGEVQAGILLPAFGVLVGAARWGQRHLQPSACLRCQ